MNFWSSKISAKSSEVATVAKPEQKVAEPVKRACYEIDGNLIVNGNLVAFGQKWQLGSCGDYSGSNSAKRKEMIGNSKSVEILGSPEASVEKIQQLEKDVSDLKDKLRDLEQKFEILSTR